ncbi:MAG: Flp pilus assembly complex ATPase component TadA [Candidatus Pacebacteria bacterium]|nr:Flp pilus assembly complex ATPase component TadA [Candidatus Paceibacterota bacterium]
MLQFLQILVAKGLLQQNLVEDIVREAESTGVSVEQVLLAQGVAESSILEAKGEMWGVPVERVSGDGIPFDTLKIIPEDSARHYRVVPLGLYDGVLHVGLLDPDNVDALDALNFISTKEGVPFKVFLISESDYTKVLEMYHGVMGEVNMALSELETAERAVPVQNNNRGGQEEGMDDLDAAIAAASTKGGASEIHDDAPVTKIVSTILRSAIDARASDIHIEPTREQLRVRFRVDGVLQTSLVLPTKVSRAVVARVKVLSGIKLDERRKPQDGRFSVTVSGRIVDFRVSTFPVTYGEKVVLRILDSARGKITLETLGMDDYQLQQVRDAVASPYGIILITGPTGSGKSTTLYAMMEEIHRDTANVISLEDPVEYDIEGVSQSQVRPEIGYTFASGIRSVLRQDPDVIMVGEIRDKETAQLAVQAALTGHLVLSTLHTNNAIGAVPRLIDMGVDPFLLAPTMRLVIAQRLVRKICPDTGKPIPIEGALKQRLDKLFAPVPEQYRSRIPETTSLLGIQPTSTCPIGTRGRIGVFELMTVNEHLRTAILDSVREAELQEIGFEHGMFTMEQDAFIKAMRKMIPYEEIAQVSSAIDTDGIADTAQPEGTAEPAEETDEKSSIKDEKSYQHDLV